MAKKNVPYDQEYYDKEIETMPREQLEELQLGYLKDELKFAYDNCPYYKRAWDEAGVSPEIETLADLEKFPFINKQTERDTQGVGSFFGELCGVPEDDVVYMATSSGSTGVPTMSPFTQGDFEDFMKAESRLFWQAGMRPNDRYLHGMNFALYVGGPCVIGAQELGALGVDFFELPKASPKAEKTKAACMQVIGYLLHEPLLLQSIRKTACLPGKTLMQELGVNSKVLPRGLNFVGSVCFLYCISQMSSSSFACAEMTLQQSETLPPPTARIRST